MLCEIADAPAPESELQHLRAEHGLLVDLLNVDRTKLRIFMTVAARALTRVRTQLHQRAREPDLFLKKLACLHTLYAQLHRQALGLSLMSLAQLFANTEQALATPSVTTPSGDLLLPALVHIDAAFLALTTVAQRTGIPLVARRSRRRRTRQVKSLTTSTPCAESSPTGSQSPPFIVALQQLGERMAAELGKRIELTTVGLELVPDEYASAFFDMLSQMLRNAIEHGIETPAERSAKGKNVRGALLVEFKPRGDQSELILQDDGQGLNVERIVHAAVSSGLINDDTTLAQDPRQASKLIFHPGLSTAANTSGRGLGMRIVRDNVKRLDGQIQVATKRGQFTRIRIRLPSLSGASVRPASAQA